MKDSAILKKLTVNELKNHLIQFYKILSGLDNYVQEKRADKLIHKIKKELERRKIYVKEKIKPEFVKIK